MEDLVVDKELVIGLFKCEQCGMLVEDEDEADLEPFCSEDCQEESEDKQVAFDF